ncbi:hypothetical protein BDV28DRAFT_144675 [Aspergillus coremiiformis]|uniref:Uncharacterized protein n=1 Tax=Aspergillus coremiiformis TaxID=138285 RepID=A0A5N6ZI01_9EURO|nr:hypothetical protein BDV28DRAFT_144675 [Aspergillus coremiiformis]
MSTDRVIMDSDDEDDPLAADFPPPVNPAHKTDNYALNLDAQDVFPMAPAREPNHPIMINFDAFLQPRDTAPAELSSSQQRREERWIPNEVGAGGSIGSTMTEIGLAQRRLFDDDDAQYPDQHLPPSPALGPEAIQPDISHADTVHLVPAFEVNGPQGIEYNRSEGTPGYVYQTNDTVAYQYEPMPRAEQQYPHHSLLSTDFSQSAASYNLFESSLQPSRSSDIMSFLRPDIALQNEVQNNPRRWNSEQGIPSSPHDTEPNSSLLSAKASRSRSDNASSNGVSRVELPQPAQNPNGLPQPVAIEPTAEPKKRGRPKKQNVQDTGDNEPTYPDLQETVEVNNKAEKRKPGRPPKNAKADAEHNDPSDTNNQPDDHIPPSNEPEIGIPPNDPNLPTSTEKEILRIKLPNAPQTNQDPPPTTHNPNPQNTEAPKEPKKKKLKRGKTTSITLQKTYDPDIEADVIWIDDAPPNPLQDQHPATNEPSHPIDPANDNQIPLDPTTVQPEAGPPPKKRGRKRKKTSDSIVVEESADRTDKPSDINLEQSHVQQQETPADALLDETTINNLGALDASHSLQTGPDNTHSEPAPALVTNDNLPTTPKKSGQEPQTPCAGPGASNTESLGKGANKGPGKHSPISTGKVPYRVGLSRKARIAPLLKIVKR